MKNIDMTEVVVGVILLIVSLSALAFSYPYMKCSTEYMYLMVGCALILSIRRKLLWTWLFIGLIIGAVV